MSTPPQGPPQRVLPPPTRRAAPPAIHAATFEFTPRAGGFQALTADTLGNAGTETDGFDSAFKDVALALAAEGDPGAALDSDLGEAGFTLGTFESDNLAPIASGIGSAVESGDRLVDDLTGVIGASAGTPPTVGPAPGGTGTGTGTGTGGGGAGTGGGVVGAVGLPYLDDTGNATIGPGGVTGGPFITPQRK